MNISSCREGCFHNFCQYRLITDKKYWPQYAFNSSSHTHTPFFFFFSFLATSSLIYIEWDRQCVFWFVNYQEMKSHILTSCKIQCFLQQYGWWALFSNLNTLKQTLIIDSSLFVCLFVCLLFFFGTRIPIFQTSTWPLLASIDSLYSNILLTGIEKWDIQLLGIISLRGSCL